jgi:hypothetical protein
LGLLPTVEQLTLNQLEGITAINPATRKQSRLCRPKNMGRVGGGGGEGGGGGGGG